MVPPLVKLGHYMLLYMGQLHVNGVLTNSEAISARELAMSFPADSVSATFRLGRQAQRSSFKLQQSVFLNFS